MCLFDSRVTSQSSTHLVLDNVLLTFTRSHCQFPPDPLRYHGLTMITVANSCFLYQLSGSTLPFSHHSITSNTGYYVFSQHAHNCHTIMVHVQCVDWINSKKQNNSNRVISTCCHHSFDHDQRTNDSILQDLLLCSDCMHHSNFSAFLR